jgi:hypothetical protein
MQDDGTSEAASSSATCQRPRRAPLSEAQDPESEPEVVMEDMESDDATKDRPILGELIREASTTMDEEDAELVFNHTRFRRDKVKRRYFRYYHGRRIIIERGATIEEFDECTPREQAVLDAQGWIDMVEDHRSAMLCHSVGVLCKPPPETRRLVSYVAHGDNDRGDPNAHQSDHWRTSCT